MGDGLWRLEAPAGNEIREGSTNSRRFLIDNGIAGGFPPDVQEALEADFALVGELDRWAFTVWPELELRVSELVNGAEGLDDWLLRFRRVLRASASGFGRASTC